MKTLDVLKAKLQPGHVYRRAKLSLWSNAVDRHLQELLREGTLKKMSQGLYYCPKQASFGDVPPKDDELVQTFLKSNDFLLTSYNHYNALGVGTSQLYNHQVVYNHKRHGTLKLGGKFFEFRSKHKFPLKLTREFLLVDLLNNLDDLAENKEAVLAFVKKKYFSPASFELQRMVCEYGKERTKTLLKDCFQPNLAHA